MRVGGQSVSGEGRATLLHQCSHMAQCQTDEACCCRLSNANMCAAQFSRQLTAMHADSTACLCRAVLCCASVECRYDFFLQSPVLAGQMRYECEFDWGGTRIFMSTAIVEGLRCFFIEPRNAFFQTPTVYGRYDDEVRF